MKVLRIVTAVLFALTLGLLPGRGEAAPGDISTVVGAGVAATTLALPYGVAVDGAGNLYIADSANNRVLKLAAGTTTVTTVAGNGTASYSGDGGLATQAGLSGPEAVAVDGAGNLYIADTNNWVVRKVAAGTGTISTLAGNHVKASSGDNGPATAASLKRPMSLALNSAGDLYIADFSGNGIRKVTAASGVISTVTTLTFPTGVAVDSSDNLYIVDNWTSRVWKMAGGTGNKTAVAGNGVAGYAGDNGPATAANLNQPYGLTIDASGNLYITEMVNRIRKVDASTGIISVLAGTGEAAYSGDGGPALDAALNRPTGVALDSSGNLYIGDSGNNAIRMILGNNPPVVTVAPAGGTYTSLLTVQLSADRPAIVYYTTDGTLPSFTSESFSGSGELSIAASTTLKYFASDLDGNSSSVATQTYSIVPGAPTAVSATAGSGKATVSFSAPAFTAGGVTSYRVTSSPGGISATGSTTSIEVSGLNAGTAYTFTVTAANATGSGPASAPSNSVTPSAITTYALSLAFTGTGGGSVNGGMSCVNGSTCTPGQFQPNTVVTLIASADANSTFGGWTGCSTVSGSSCSVTMSGAKNVSTSFVAAAKARIMGGASYGLLADAYAAALANAVIQARNVLFDDGVLTLGRPVAVKLIGGYDTSFGSRSGRTPVKGKIQVRSGTLRVDGVTLR